MGPDQTVVLITDPGGDGWVEINPSGDAAAAVVAVAGGETATVAFTAKLDVNGDLVIATDVARQLRSRCR